MYYIPQPIYDKTNKEIVIYLGFDNNYKSWVHNGKRNGKKQINIKDTCPIHWNTENKPTKQNKWNIFANLPYEVIKYGNGSFFNYIKIPNYKIRKALDLIQIGIDNKELIIKETI